MNIPITLTVHTSSQFASKKDGKHYVKITASSAALGLFQFIVPEERIPDTLEGQTVKAIFQLYVGRDFSVRFGFDKIEGYAQ